jgi:hypothetical protein
MLADHFEPLQGGRSTIATACERVRAWREAWPRIAERHRDSMGRPAQYTFFYPQEDYRPELLEPLAEMARMEIGDVEVHIHHDGEGQQNFVDRMKLFKSQLREGHSLLREHNGQIAFAFIHGNWALDNSHPEGRFCGLNNEITLLRDLGCYADFTLPSAPDPAQTRIVNTIYWAVDDPTKPKSHDKGMPVMKGRKSTGDLLMIPGPLGVRIGENRRMVPRIEMGEIAANDLPNRYRTGLWLDLAPRVGDSIFVKLHTHGATDRNLNALLEGGLDMLFSSMAAECEKRGLELRYGTAWDFYKSVACN